MYLWKSDKPLALAVAALLVCICFNIYSTWKIQRTFSVGDSQYSYIDDDYPVELPIKLDTVALTMENTVHYATSSPWAWSEWRSLGQFPKANGFVRLGPSSRTFGVSMFHQIHCLDILRQSVLGTGGYPNEHTHHCLNRLRQAVLCAADTTIDPLNSKKDGVLAGTDGTGTTHICRDWTKIYDFVTNNQNSWVDESKDV